MAVDAIEWGALCSAVKTVLDAVTGIGLVESRPGGVATWVRRPRSGQAFWEIDVTGTEERGAAIGTDAYDLPLVRIDGYLPWSYSNPDSAAVWRPLVRRVRAALRSAPTLGGAVQHSELPQVRINERVQFDPGGNGDLVLCHHVVLEVRVRTFFTYTVS